MYSPWCIYPKDRVLNGCMHERILKTERDNLDVLYLSIIQEEEERMHFKNAYLDFEGLLCYTSKI